MPVAKTQNQGVSKGTERPLAYTSVRSRQVVSRDGETHVTESTYEQSPDAGFRGYLRVNETSYFVEPIPDGDRYVVREYRNRREVDSTVLSYDEVMALARRFGDRTQLLSGVADSL